MLSLRFTPFILNLFGTTRIRIWPTLEHWVAVASGESNNPNGQFHSQQNKNQKNGIPMKAIASVLSVINVSKSKSKPRIKIKASQNDFRYGEKNEM